MSPAQVFQDLEFSRQSSERQSHYPLSLLWPGSFHPFYFAPRTHSHGVTGGSRIWRGSPPAPLHAASSTILTGFFAHFPLKAEFYPYSLFLPNSGKHSHSSICKSHLRQTRSIAFFVSALFLETRSGRGCKQPPTFKLGLQEADLRELRRSRSGTRVTAPLGIGAPTSPPPAGFRPASHFSPKRIWCDSFLETSGIFGKVGWAARRVAEPRGGGRHPRSSQDLAAP